MRKTNKVKTDKEYWRIIRYNYACVLFDLGQYPESEKKVSDLIMEYYDVLGLSLEDVLGKNPSEIQEKLSGTGIEQDDLKHLADSLDLYAQVRNAQGKKSGLARLHAVKFYDMSNAVRSLVRVGQDVVDEYLGLIRDPNLARQFMESTLLPTIESYKLFDYLIQVQAQYAVILAYCGEIERANKEMERLGVFVDTLQGVKLAEFEKQKQLILEIAKGNIKLGYRPEVSGGSTGNKTLFESKPKIGRNSPCPCGSGKKFKHCCGK